MTKPQVVVTGASKGIGAAIAKELAEDYHLILLGQDENKLAELTQQLPSAEYFIADLTQSAEIANISRKLEKFSKIRGLVHSAGLLVNGEIKDLSFEDWLSSFSLNLFAPALLSKALLPALSKDLGTIVFINSGSGFNASEGAGAYSASKFALRALSDTLRLETKASGVRICSVHPGRTDTAMQHKLRQFEAGEYEAEKYLKPSSVAKAVRFALAAPPEASIDVISIRPR